jgi:histidinol-phosphate aminotransferase
VATVAAFSDAEFIRKVQTATWEGLDYFSTEFKKMGLDFVPSQGNFIFFDTRQDADGVFRECLKKGIIVRPLKNYGFATQLRLSVGLMEENRQAIEVISQVLKIRR